MCREYRFNLFRMSNGRFLQSIYSISIVKDLKVTKKEKIANSENNQNRIVFEIKLFSNYEVYTI